jgi:signal transduction histidine kinase
MESRVAGRSFSLTEGLLLGYVLYSSGLCILARIHSPLAGKTSRWEQWADAGTFSALVILDGQRNGFFCCGLFLSFLVASFRRGPASAMRVTVASTVVISASLLVVQMRAHRPDLESLLIPPVALLVLGAMVAHWAGFEIVLKRRLEFISGMTRISNPRLGAAHMISSFMEQLRAFYDADTCIMVSADLGEPEIRLRRVDRLSPGKGEHAVSLPPDVVSCLLGLPPQLAVVRQMPAKVTFNSQNGYFEYDVARGVRTMEARETSEKLVVTLDAGSLLTVPLRYRNDTIGRIFLTSSRRCFEESDVFFLIQVFEQFMPVIDNIRLVDGIAADAGSAERKRIARDLHDSVIQPYVGLKLGVGSLRQKLAARTLQVNDIDRLIAISDEAIADLRRYVSQLKGQVEREGDLLGAVRRFAAKFSYATGISIDIDADENLSVNDRLAAEAFQIVAEGLSNIRRHTQSMRARVGLACVESQLVVRIANVGNGGSARAPFMPRSITERAEALGGRSSVEFLTNGESSVVVEVPL